MIKINEMKTAAASYAAPSMNVLDLCSEGLLCQSLADRPDNKYDDNIMPEI